MSLEIIASHRLKFSVENSLDRQFLVYVEAKIVGVKLKKMGYASRLLFYKVCINQKS